MKYADYDKHIVASVYIVLDESFVLVTAVGKKASQWIKLMPTPQPYFCR